VRRIDGVLQPFEAVRSQIADYLATAAWQRGVHQYRQILVGRAHIEGVTLEGSQSPLVQ
jgi:peptidyl-prolyl cis-trans isomerase C